MNNFAPNLFHLPRYLTNLFPVIRNHQQGSTMLVTCLLLSLSCMTFAYISLLMVHERKNSHQQLDRYLCHAWKLSETIKLTKTALKINRFIAATHIAKIYPPMIMTLEKIKRIAKLYYRTLYIRFHIESRTKKWCRSFFSTKSNLFFHPSRTHIDGSYQLQYAKITLKTPLKNGYFHQNLSLSNYLATLKVEKKPRFYSGQINTIKNILSTRHHP